MGVSAHGRSLAAHRVWSVRRPPGSGAGGDSGDRRRFQFADHREVRRRLRQRRCRRLHRLGRPADDHSRRSPPARRDRGGDSYPGRSPTSSWLRDRLTRDGRWADKLELNGRGLTGRTLGIIGLGNIGRELARLIRPFEMRVQAADPWVKPEAAADNGVELVSLEELLQTSDFVCVTCALTDDTRHLLSAQRLQLIPADVLPDQRRPRGRRRSGRAHAMPSRRTDRRSGTRRLRSRADRSRRPAAGPRQRDCLTARTVLDG